MSRFIFWLVLAVVVVWWLRRPRGEATRAAPPPAPTPAALPAMVECAVCHVHLPAAEALSAPDGRRYCCAAHRDLAPERPA